MKVYGIGSIVSYSPFGGGSRTIKIISKEDDIKNGRPGFDGIGVQKVNNQWEEKPGEYYWGYDYQIINIVA